MERISYAVLIILEYDTYTVIYRSAINCNSRSKLLFQYFIDKIGVVNYEKVDLHNALSSSVENWLC